MTGATLALPGIDVDAAAAEIARLAVSDAAATGRPCRLADRDLVAALLHQLAKGERRTTAAESVGLNECVFRRWMKPGTLPAAACAELQRVVSAVESEAAARALLRVRLSASIEASVTLPADVSSVYRAPVLAAPVVAPAPLPAPPPAKVYPVPSLGTVLAWHHRTERSRQLAPTDPNTARWLLEDVKREIATYGLSEVPPAPARWLPYGLSYTDVQHRYIAWCQATGRRGPTDCEIELEARRWYLARRLPEITG
jgi:hypothetical protein